MECEKWYICPTMESMSQLRAWVSDESTWTFYWDIACSAQFLFLCFLKECHGMSRLTSHSSSPCLFIRVGMIGIWYYIQLLLLYSIILLNPSCPPDSYSIGWNTPDIKNVRSQYAVPTSGTQNPQYGFLFSILRSDTAVELHLNIDAYETPSFRLPHALSLALQRHFKRVICPTC